MQVEYSVMIWPHVCRLPEPNVGERKGEVAPAFCMWQVRLSLLTRSSKCRIVTECAVFFMKSLHAGLAGEGAVHMILPFSFVLNTVNSVPAKAEHKGVGGERSQQGFRCQSCACAHPVLSPGMTNFHFYTCRTIFRHHSLEMLGISVSRGPFRTPL